MKLLLNFDNYIVRLNTSISWQYERATIITEIILTSRGRMIVSDLEEKIVQLQSQVMYLVYQIKIDISIEYLTY